MPASPNGAAARETVIPMRTANISRSTPSNHVLLAVFAQPLLALINYAAGSQFYSYILLVPFVSPGSPADPADVATYVNYMITLPTPGSGDFLNQQITRSSNTFGIPLPQADANIIAQSDPKNLTTTIDLGAGGVYKYLFAKYDGRNDNSQVWYVG